MIENEKMAEMSEKEKKVFSLYLEAKKDDMALRLYELIQLECEMILKTPDSAPEYMVRTFNRLVRSSNLPLPKRQSLLMEEKR